MPYAFVSWPTVNRSDSTHMGTHNLGLLKPMSSALEDPAAPNTHVAGWRE